MKVIYIHQYFRTPEEGGAIRSYHMAKELVLQGYEVEMVTAHNKRHYKKATVEGFSVHYLPVHYSNHFGFWKRLVAFMRFFHLSFRLIRKLGHADLVYATSTPLTVGWLALKIKKKLGIRYLFEVRDLWPDAPIEMGVIKSGFLKRWLFELEKKIYDNSEGVVVLSPPVKSIVSTRTNKEVFLVPNFADIGFFNQNYGTKGLLKSLGAENHFLVAYTGAVGRVNKLENLLEIADCCLKRRLPAKFLVIGDGASLNILKRESERRNLTNMVFIPHQDKQNVGKYLHLADAAFISFDKPNILETSSPNKLFDAMACGKLIIYNKNGWIRELIETNSCGFYADPDNPDLTCDIIASFINAPEKLKAYQQNALHAATYFSKEKLMEEFARIIGSVRETLSEYRSKSAARMF
jgi:glycosyltransferase involved in cell wall biosynthesis